MQKESTLVPVQEFTRNKGCFACGSENPFGLHMTFTSDGQRVVSRVIVPNHMCGWGNLVHGGIITTILDETMSWTAIHLLRRLILTRSIQVDFLQPVAPDIALRAEGLIENQIKTNEAQVSACLYVEPDQLCARATGRFALLDARMTRRLKILDEQIIQDFEKRYGQP